MMTWGEWWIKNLEGIDDRNRLAGGREWAEKGAVLDWMIKEGTVYAKVGGHFNQSFKVALQFPSMPSSDQEKMQAYFSADSYRLLQLQNNIIPADIKPFIRENIQLAIPTHFADIRMQCSCEQSARPCRHVSALFYHLAKEIDQDALLFFQLQSLVITTNVDQSDTLARQTFVVPFFSWLQERLKGDAMIAGHGNLVDFSNLPFFNDKRLSFLKNRATNSTTDDKLLLLKGLAKLKKRTSFFEDELCDAVRDFRGIFSKSDQISLIFNDLGGLSSVLLETNGEFQPVNSTAPIALLIQLLVDYDEGQFRGISEIWKWKRQMLRFCDLLLTRQMLQPKVVANSEQWCLQWFPATYDPVIRQVLDDLTAALPCPVAFIKTNVGVSALSSKQQTLLVAQCILTDRMRQLTATLGHSANASVMAKALYSDHCFSLQDQREMALASNIEQWLAPLQQHDFETIIILQMEESEIEGHFVLRLLARDSDAPLGSEQSIRAFLLSAPNSVQQKLFQRIEPLWAHFPVMKTLMTVDQEVLSFNQQELSNVLVFLFPQLEAIGIDVRLDKRLRKLVQPKLSFKITAKEEDGEEDGKQQKGQLDIKSLFKYEWQVAIGDQQVSAEEFENYLEEIEGVVKIKDQYVHLIATDVAKLMARLQDEHQKLPSHEFFQAIYTQKYESAPVFMAQDASQRLSLFNKVRQVLPPKGLKATLRPYQLVGFEWLMRNASIGMGAILADDMGLGKTLQTLAFLLKLKEEQRLSYNKPAIVVVPTSLLTNWQAEINKFTPDITTNVYHGQMNSLSPTFDVLITTYGKVRTSFDQLKKISWEVMIIDEAQHIKNADTKQSQLIKSLPSVIKVALSGTPVENRLMEYWSIMDFVNPSILGSASEFQRKFVKPIEDQDLQRLSDFHNICRPFLMRRLKSDRSIIADLPEKIEQNHFCSLAPEQSALYQSVMEQAMFKMEATEQKKRSSIILQLITTLKQVCNHPFQYLASGEQAPWLSGKATALMELLEKIQPTGEKVLIFTQYRQMGELLRRWIYQFMESEAMFLHGGCSRKERDEMVTQFQTSASKQFFILSLKAAGTGLNLVQATHVVHYDLWWNPAVEAQATDRAYRIGQQKNVMVHRLISKGTFEEQINQLIQKKKVLADEVVQAGGEWIGNLPDEELKQIFSLKEE